MTPALTPRISPPVARLAPWEVAVEGDAFAGGAAEQELAVLVATSVAERTPRSGFSTSELRLDTPAGRE